MSITTKQVDVSPALAEAILTKHYERVAKSQFRQRPVYKSIVRKYALDMKAGNWTETPLPIIFDENGDLADGQHRLEAVQASGKTITFTFAEGWPVNVIDAIDRGRNRNIANQMHMHGIQNSTIYASAVNCLVRVCYRGEAPPISYAASMHILDKFDARRHIDRMMEITSKIKRTGRTIGPLAFYRTVAVKKADEFMTRMVTMDMEKGTGPALYSKYMRDRKVDDQGDACRALCTCIRLWDNDETADHLRGGGYYGIDYLAGRNKKLVENIKELLGPDRHNEKLVLNPHGNEGK